MSLPGVDLKLELTDDQALALLVQLYVQCLAKIGPAEMARRIQAALDPLATFRDSELIGG